MGTLADEAAHDAFQRTVLDLNHHALADQRTRIELEITVDESANAVNLVLRDGCRLSLERHDVDDASAFENGERFLFIEAREAVAGKQGPVDLLLTIFPAAPACNGWEERVEMLALDLVAHDLFMTRARPDGEPARGHFPGLERWLRCDADLPRL